MLLPAVLRGEEVARFGRSVRMNVPPRIDGRLEPSIWSAAPALTNFTRVIYGTGPASGQTYAFIGHDDERVYVGIDCREPHSTALQDQVAKGRFNGFEESVELFIQPDESGTYYQFMVSISGKRHESRALDGTWSAPWQAEVHVDQRGHSVEISIPVATLGTRLEVGALWRLNVNRTRSLSPTIEYSCWSNTGGGFHMPERFGFVVCGPYETYFRGHAGRTLASASEEIEFLFRDYPASTQALGPLRDQVVDLTSALTLKLGPAITTEDQAIGIFKRIRELERRLDDVTSTVRLAIIRNEFRD